MEVYEYHDVWFVIFSLIRDWETIKALMFVCKEWNAWIGEMMKTKLVTEMVPYQSRSDPPPSVVIPVRPRRGVLVAMSYDEQPKPLIFHQTATGIKHGSYTILDQYSRIIQKGVYVFGQEYGYKFQYNVSAFRAGPRNPRPHNPGPRNYTEYLYIHPIVQKDLRRYQYTFVNNRLTDMIPFVNGEMDGIALKYGLNNLSDKGQMEIMHVDSYDNGSRTGSWYSFNCDNTITLTLHDKGFISYQYEYDRYHKLCGIKKYHQGSLRITQTIKNGRVRKQVLEGNHDVINRSIFHKTTGDLRMVAYGYYNLTKHYSESRDDMCISFKNGHPTKAIFELVSDDGDDGDDTLIEFDEKSHQVKSGKWRHLNGGIYDGQKFIPRKVNKALRLKPKAYNLPRPIIALPHPSCYKAPNIKPSDFGI